MLPDTGGKVLFPRRLGWKCYTYSVRMSAEGLVVQTTEVIMV